MPRMKEVSHKFLRKVSQISRSTGKVDVLNKGIYMSSNNQTLTHCPACGEELQVLPVYGSSQHFTCPTHRTFGLSLSAIAMMNGNDNYREVIGQRIRTARDNEQILITSEDLISPNS